MAQTAINTIIDDAESCEHAISEILDLDYLYLCKIANESYFLNNTIDLCVNPAKIEESENNVEPSWVKLANCYQKYIFKVYNALGIIRTSDFDEGRALKKYLNITDRTGRGSEYILNAEVELEDIIRTGKCGFDDELVEWKNAYDSCVSDLEKLLFDVKVDSLPKLYACETEEKMKEQWEFCKKMAERVHLDLDDVPWYVKKYEELEKQVIVQSKKQNEPNISNQTYDNNQTEVTEIPNKDLSISKVVSEECLGDNQKNDSANKKGSGTVKPKQPKKKGCLPKIVIVVTILLGIIIFWGPSDEPGEEINEEPNVQSESSLSQNELEETGTTEAEDENGESEPFDYEQHVEEKYGALEGTIGFDDEGNMYLTEAGIIDNLNYMLIERIEQDESCIGCDIISVTANEEYKMYECVTEFLYDNCLVRANIILDYQGTLAGASVEERFNGALSQELYNPFCRVIGCIATYFNEDMWNEISSMLTIEASSGVGSKEQASNRYNAYYVFDYDIETENNLAFSIYFPMG